MSKWDQTEQGRAAARLMRMVIASVLILFSLVLIAQALTTSTLPSRSSAQPQKNSDPIIAILDQIAWEDNPRSAVSTPTNLLGDLIRTSAHLFLPAIIGLLIYPWGKSPPNQTGLPQVAVITPPNASTPPPPLSPPKSIAIPKSPPSQAAPPQDLVIMPQAQAPSPPLSPPKSVAVPVASLAPPPPEPPKPEAVPMVVIESAPAPVPLPLPLPLTSVVPPIPIVVAAALTSAVPQWLWWKSRIVLVGGFIVVSDLLFPPWRLWANHSNVRLSKPGDRHFFFDPPTVASQSPWSTEIDFSRLSVEVVAIVGLTVLLLLIRAPRPATRIVAREL